jgi:hypothetical protein
MIAFKNYSLFTYISASLIKTINYTIKTDVFIIIIQSQIRNFSLCFKMLAEAYL